MQWPQITLIVLMAMTVTAHAIKHGQPRSDFDVLIKLIDVSIISSLLYAGGFFSA